MSDKRLLKSYLINQGTNSIVIDNVFEVDNVKLNVKLKELFKPLVVDENTIPSIVRVENLEKLKEGFVYEMSFLDNKKKLLAFADFLGVKTPQIVIEDLKDIVKEKEFVDPKFTPELQAKMLRKGYGKVDINNKGVINSVRLKVLYQIIK